MLELSVPLKGKWGIRKIYHVLPNQPSCYFATGRCSHNKVNCGLFLFPPTPGALGVVVQ